MKQSFKMAMVVAALCAGSTSWAQTKIGNNPTSINTDAILELESSNRGFLLPRLQLTSTTSATPLTAHVQGMTVYNTATAGAGATAVTPGFYYNDGTKWVRIADQASINTLYTGDGTLTGNRIVTTGANNLSFSGTGSVSIGNTTTPNTNAILELSSSNKGLLLPRLALTSTSSTGPLTAHVAGMIVYNTATAGTGTIAVTPGYYFNTGTGWIRIDAQSNIYNNDGTITNNRTINTGGNNVYFTGGGKIAINNNNPTSFLDVNGSVSFPIRTVNTGTATTLDSNDYALQITSAVTGAYTINLPAASTVTDRMYVLVNQSTSPKTVTAYIDLNGNTQTTLPANSSITLQANASGQWIQTAASYLPSTATGALIATYEAMGTTQRLVDFGATKVVDGVTTTFNVPAGSTVKAIITVTGIAVPTSLTVNGAAAHGRIIIDVDGVDESSAAVSGYKSGTSQQMSSPTTITKIVTLTGGTHTITLEAESWGGDMLFNYTPAAPAQPAAYKSRMSIEVYKQ